MNECLIFLNDVILYLSAYVLCVVSFTFLQSSFHKVRILELKVFPLVLVCLQEIFFSTYLKKLETKYHE